MAVKRESRRMARIAAAGDNVVDCYAALERMFPGGNCLNLAVFARRLGHQTAYVGAIGEDAAGRAIRRALLEEGVATERLRVVAHGRSAYCMIGNDNGERVFLDHDLGVSRFVPHEGDLAYIATFDAVHVGQSSGLDDHLGQFAASTRLSFDFSTKRTHPRRDEILPRCFLAAFSAGSLPDGEVCALAEYALARGAAWVLLTRGRLGAVLARRGARFEVPAAPCQLVDTLGAGDAFTACTLGALLDGQEAPEAFLTRAAALAALTCEHFGAIGHGVRLELQPCASGRQPIDGGSCDGR
jgi:fructoselysine 6-kinase